MGEWDAVTRHRFTDDLAAGSIERDVLKRYLVQDHRFLDAFVVLLATAVAKVRSLDDRVPGCQFLALITGKENTYFERSFEALGISAEDRAQTPNRPCTEQFIELMRGMSSEGTLGEILSVLVVCEWTYMSWGERVVEKTVRDDFFCYEWVDLHSGAYFQGVVEYLRKLLDGEGVLMDDAQREKCRAAFSRTLRLEKAFFDDCYSDEQNI